MASSDFLEVRLQHVSRAFLEQFEVKLQAIESIWATFNEPGSDQTELLQQMSDIAHELHGQGSFFGYPEVTECAGVIDDAISTLLLQNEDVTPEALYAIRNNIDRLKGSVSKQDSETNAFKDDLDTLRTLTENFSNNESSSQSKCILLIDDAEVMRDKIALTLRQAGYEVLEAEDGGTGIALAYERIPDLILLDIKMPEIDGFEVQRTIRRHDDLVNVPIVLLTSLSRVTLAQVQESLSFGISDYIAKPFNMKKLIEKVHRVLSP